MAPSMLGDLPTGKWAFLGLTVGGFIWLQINQYHTEKIIVSKYRQDKIHLHRIQQAVYKDLVDDFDQGKYVPASLSAEKVQDICLRREEKDVERCKAFFTEFYETVVQSAKSMDPKSIQAIDKVDFFAREPYLKNIGRGTYGRMVMDAAYGNGEMTDVPRIDDADSDKERESV